MVNKALTNTFLPIIALSLACSPSYANSEDYAGKPNVGFFNHGAVVDMSIELEGSEQPEIQYGPPKSFKIEEKKEVAAKLQANPAAAALNAEEETIPPGVDPQEFLLKKEYGDPDQPTPVKGIDSAPSPYKAMLRAIEMGRDDLALKYANQLKDYRKKLDLVTRKAVAMDGVVKLDSTSDADQVSHAALSNIDPKALDTYFAERKDKLASRDLTASLEVSEDSREAIKAVFGDTDSQQSALNESEDAAIDPYDNLVDTNIDATIRKLLIRSTLAGKLPIDPSGKVQVLFFMRPSEQSSVNIGKEIGTALSSTSLDVSLSVVPLSVEGVDYKGNARFFEKTGIPSIVRDGLSLSRSLNITQFPALFFTTANSNEAFLKTGKADSVFIEEVARIIGGK